MILMKHENVIDAHQSKLSIILFVQMYAYNFYLQINFLNSVIHNTYKSIELSEMGFMSLLIHIPNVVDMSFLMWQSIIKSLDSNRPESYLPRPYNEIDQIHQTANYEWLI